ncbi:hypothetical protein PHMEG_00025047 [Phytophthora megakarya]|uniref:RING-type domain-containing protein n=1 Tax=Phytophthora megakarya TaxID=4795 RepID=A0A225VE80_9STRA|nr:hypothetical protein PHMEG_00025047 [Phytophthora megakarya]
MVGSRRVRKRSPSTSSLLPTYVGLLEHLHLTLQSARDNKRPLFILQVHRRNTCSGRHSPTRNSSWRTPHPFEDFETLHNRLVLALQHGHFCNAGCPWLFSFLTSEFPKKHIFQRNCSPKTVEARREKLLELLTSTLEFLLDKKNHACIVATTDVAKLVAEFLYGQDSVAQFMVETCSKSESSNNSSQPSLGVLCGDEEDPPKTSLMTCGVCNAPLISQVEKGNQRCSSISPVHSGSRRRSSVYATVLQCGHQFHDECILPVLNDTLRCPTCHHLEIQ